MKVLTATTRMQGQRPGDFTFCTDGEVVTPVRLICDRDRADPDGGCGCGRAFAGLNSHRATTTAVVTDLPGYTIADLTLAVLSYREQAGWASDDAFTAAGDAAEEAAEIAAIAAEHLTGTVLQIRLDDVTVREG